MVEVDKEQNLSVHLICEGYLPGGTMQKSKAGVRNYISRNEYGEFMPQIRRAELYARKKKLGVWVKE